MEFNTEKLTDKNLRPEVFLPVEAGDISEFLDLMRDFYAEENYAFHEESARKAIAQFLGHSDLGRVWFVVVDGERVGYLALTYGFTFEHGGRDAFIDEFYIGKTHRSRGAGRRAMDFAEAQAAEEGIRAIHLEVERKNKDAERLYAGRGYSETNRKLLTKKLDLEK